VVFSAPIAIGKANISGEDMYMSAMKGKCLNMIHVYQDSLWALGDQSIQVPLISPPSTNAKTETKPEETGISEPSAETEAKIDDIVKSVEQVKIEDAPKPFEKTEKNQELNVETTNIETVDHEKILTDSFLIAIKFKSKDLKLPVIVSSFMKLMQNCW
jgi:translation initiation factor 2D